MENSVRAVNAEQLKKDHWKRLPSTGVKPTMRRLSGEGWDMSVHNCAVQLLPVRVRATGLATDLVRPPDSFFFFFF